MAIPNLVNPPSVSVPGPANGVVDPNGVPTVTPAQLDMRRQYGMGMLQAGADTSPIRSWTQGAARLADALVGGRAIKAANTQQYQGSVAAQQALTDALSGGSGGGVDMAALMKATNNPFMSPGQTALAGAIMQRQWAPPTYHQPGEVPADINGNQIGPALGTDPKWNGGGGTTANADASIEPRPPGFIFNGAKQWEDPPTGRKGLIDMTGKIWVTSHANPTSDQAQASGAYNEAVAANEIIKKNEKAWNSAAAAAGDGIASIPVVGPLLTAGREGARELEGGKQRFMAAVRGMAIAAKLNPDSAEFSEKSLYAPPQSSDAEIAQYDAHRQAIIDYLKLRAGPFAGGNAAGASTGAPAPAPGAPAGAPVVGAIDGGYRFKGGNPADPASWEPVQ